MKKKSSFLFKSICLSIIVVSILIFVFVITNLEETKVKTFSSEKVNLNTESQEEVVKVTKPELKEVVIEEETNNSYEEEQEKEQQEVVTTEEKDETKEESNCGI